MMKALLLVSISCVALLGCGSGDATSAANAETSGTKNKAGSKENGATVVNEVPKDGNIPAGGIVIKPPNPNDPKFKPDPRMAGGG